VVEKRRVGGVVRWVASEAVAFAAAAGLEKRVVVVVLIEEVVIVLRGEEAGLVRNLAVFIFSRLVA